MNDDTRRIDADKLLELTRLQVLLTVPGMTDVRVRHDIPYGSDRAEELGIDLYLPDGASGPLPAVVFVTGYKDQGARDLIGLRLKEWGPYVSWARLVAASGLASITYACAEPPENAMEVLRFIRENAGELHVDPDRVGIWTTSGNGPTALSLLMDRPTYLRFAVFSNTYMLDLDGDTTVADMALQFGFSAPNAGKSVADIDPDVSIFVVRSGRDEIPRLNPNLDRFIAHAVDSNLQLRFVNLPDAPHSFDLLHDTEETRRTIRQIVEFMQASTAK